MRSVYRKNYPIATLSKKTPKTRQEDEKAILI